MQRTHDEKNNGRVIELKMVVMNLAFSFSLSLSYNMLNLQLYLMYDHYDLCTEDTRPINQLIVCIYVCQYYVCNRLVSQLIFHLHKLGTTGIE